MSFISLKTEGQHVDIWRTSEESCVLTMSFLSLKREGILLSDMKPGVNTIPSQPEERREFSEIRS